MKRKSIFAGVIAILLAMGCGSITANNQESPAEDSSNEINSDKPLEQTSSLETSEDVSESKETEESTSAEDQSKDSIKEKKMEVVEFKRDGKKIYGELYKPEGEGPFPCVIIAHGFGGNCSGLRAYAKMFSDEGIATYIFDFIGGGFGSKSDGKMIDMSVLTEAADYNVVFDGIRAIDYIDDSNMFVMGESQGGFVSTYIAGTRPNDVKGLIAFFPAYVLQDDTRQRTNNGTEMPETMNIMGTTIGRIYNEDALSFDIYEVMKNYEGPALLIHGTNDKVVPFSYSEKAVQTLPNANLITIDGAGHGFGGEDWKNASQAALEFIKTHCSEKD